MSFTMYTNTSDNRVIDKSITAVGTALSCTFKDDTSMENPTIIIDAAAYNSSCNYGYLDDTGRYYYVVDVTFSQQRCYLQLKVDVLKSFASEIKACKAIATRSESKYNSYINDGEYPALQYGNPVIKKFPRGLNKGMSYVLTIAGGA